MNCNITKKKNWNTFEFIDGTIRCTSMYINWTQNLLLSRNKISAESKMLNFSYMSIQSQMYKYVSYDWFESWFIFDEIFNLTKIIIPKVFKF